LEQDNIELKEIIKYDYLKFNKKDGFLNSLLGTESKKRKEF
jgi:hypothetical protein